MGDGTADRPNGRGANGPHGRRPSGRTRRQRSGRGITGTTHRPKSRYDSKLRRIYRRHGGTASRCGLAEVLTHRVYGDRIAHARPTLIPDEGLGFGDLWLAIELLRADRPGSAPRDGTRCLSGIGGRRRRHGYTRTPLLIRMGVRLRSGGRCGRMLPGVRRCRDGGWTGKERVRGRLGGRSTAR
jgi:hypothetical protein